MEEASEKAVKVTEQVLPSPELVDYYNKAYRLYRDLYPALRDFYPRLQEL